MKTRRLAAIALLPLVSSATPAQEPRTFPAEAAVITVDVVVLDKDGEPVRGLSAADFTITDEGKPQAITSFAARERPIVVGAGAGAGESRSAAASVVAEARPADAPGAFMAILIDDLGLTAAVAEQAKIAVGEWLRERADPRDEVTLLTTSGEVWWSDTIGPGRDDLQAVLRRVRGRGTPAVTRGESMSIQEAQQIQAFEGHQIEGDRILPTGEVNDPHLPPDQQPKDRRPPAARTVLERVTNRWLDAGVCCYCGQGGCNDCPPLVRCKARVQLMAADVYAVWTRRAHSVLGALERVARGLSGVSGRKSIVLVAENLMRDGLIEDRYRRVVDAAQRSNTAVYFASALGIAGVPGYTMEETSAPRGGDLMRILAEERTLATGGAEHLADATGGIVRVSNDLAAGLERASLDASAYYLLGYQPETPLDGKWHDVRVKVARPGVTVRARRGYLATPAPALAAVAPADAGDRKGAARKDKKERKAADEGISSPELVAGNTHGAIPLRLASYVQGPDGAGAARVLVAIEVDGSRVRAVEAAGGRSAALGLTVLAVARDRNRVAPLAQSLDLKLADKDLGGWWALFREVRLPPGISQIRVLVRDKATGAVGTIAGRIDVPDVDAPYLGTPLITDRTQPSPEKGDPPRLVPSAGRRFARDRPLYCQFELFSFGGRSMPGVPQVSGGYTLQREGDVVAALPPTPIATDAHRVVRRLVLPPEKLDPGLYDLTVTVEDALARRTLTARESFRIDP